MQNLSRLQRISIALYLIWAFIHLWLFFNSGESPDSSLFWPFNSHGKSAEQTYDIAELAVYLGVPVLLFVAYRIAYGEEYYSSSGSRRHTTASFFIAFLNEKIKAEELLQQLNALKGLPVNHEHLNELKADLEKAASQNVNDWLDRFEVRKKYKEFES